MAGRGSRCGSPPGSGSGKVSTQRTRASFAAQRRKPLCCVKFPGRWGRRRALDFEGAKTRGARRRRVPPGPTAGGPGIPTHRVDPESRGRPPPTPLRGLPDTSAPFTTTLIQVMQTWRKLFASSPSGAGQSPAKRSAVRSVDRAVAVPAQRSGAGDGSRAAKRSGEAR